jgi:hypothetical protein
VRDKVHRGAAAVLGGALASAVLAAAQAAGAYGTRAGNERPCGVTEVPTVAVTGVPVVTSPLAAIATACQPTLDWVDPHGGALLQAWRPHVLRACPLQPGLHGSARIGGRDIVAHDAVGEQAGQAFERPAKARCGSGPRGMPDRSVPGARTRTAPTGDAALAMRSLSTPPQARRTRRDARPCATILGRWPSDVRLETAYRGAPSAAFEDKALLAGAPSALLPSLRPCSPDGGTPTTRHSRPNDGS